jgi:integral membrane protein (TIGR01906 family)
MINYKGFYYSEYEKNNVYEKISDIQSIDRASAESLARDMTESIFGYFRGHADLKYFTDSEKSHMADVKNLISFFRYFYYFCAIVFIILFSILYYHNKSHKIYFISRLSQSLLYGAGAALAIMLMLFLAAIFYFDALFLIFHLALFPQGNWMFDQGSLLIILFPSQFFYNISVRIFLYSTVQAGAFFVIGYWLRKQLKMYERYSGKL